MKLKLGLIAPPNNSVNQAEWERMAPEGVSLAIARMKLHADTDSDAGKKALYADLTIAMAELARHSPDVIAYGCTAGSMVLPLDTVPAFIRRVSGVPGVATSPALVHACRALKLSSISLATPYHDALNEHEREFFAANGIEVVKLKGLGIGAGGPQEYVNIARVAKQQVYEHCLSTDAPAAQGMIISCTDFAAMEAIPRLEAELGKPVVSSNLATFWMALRSAGFDEALKGWGSLLSVQSIPRAD